MTEDITTQILLQIRQDIAEVRSEVAELRVEVRGEIAQVRSEVSSLRSETRAGFARVNEQIASITAVLGHFARNDDRLEMRIAALERHVGLVPSGG